MTKTLIKKEYKEPVKERNEESRLTDGCLSGGNRIEIRKKRQMIGGDFCFLKEVTSTFEQKGR